MQETLNVGAGQPATPVQAVDTKPVRARTVERRDDRQGPAIVDKLRGEAPGIRKLAQSVASVRNQARANQQTDKALSSAQRRIAQLSELALAQRNSTPSPVEQIKSAAQFSAVELDLAAIVEPVPSVAGDLLPPLALGNANELTATISQLRAAGERIVAERSALETRQEDVRKAADALGAEPGAIDEVAAREIVDATARQIKLGQEAALSSHASSIVQEAIRALA